MRTLTAFAILAISSLPAFAVGDEPVPLPEPSALVLVGAAVAAVALFRRRK